MLSSIGRFIAQKFAAPQAESAESEQHRARLAAAALLVEVTRCDDRVSAEERAELFATMERKFGLESTEAAQLIELAEEEARQAIDMYQFTAQINRLFSREQKQRLIEELWRVAYADEVLHHHEEYLIRRIADLLHVPHSVFIAAKLRVQAAN
jgi:uncharacterized tellurite resistance protein B-like protein